MEVGDLGIEGMPGATAKQTGVFVGARSLTSPVGPLRARFDIRSDTAAAGEAGGVGF